MKTEQDLLDACRRLYDSGSRLSVRSLKNELGGGSTDRIAATLRKFKESVFDEHQDQKNEHPDELYRSIQDLHEKYEELKSSHELRVQEINELKKHIVKLQDRYTRDIRILKNENSKLKKNCPRFRTKRMTIARRKIFKSKILGRSLFLRIKDRRTKSGTQRRSR